MKRIKWYNIFYLMFNVYAYILTFKTLEHISTLNRSEIGKCRLSWITLICFIVIVIASFTLKKAYSMKKEMR